MTEAEKIINSGLLEMYVLGLSSALDTTEIEKAIASFPEVRNEMDRIIEVLAEYSAAATVPVNPTVKTSVMAAVDFTERLVAGEAKSNPTELNKDSKISDYTEWLSRKDLKFVGQEDIELRIIAQDEKMVTGLLCLKQGAPYEIHEVEVEKFLIIEGSCDIVTDSGTHSLKCGDYFAIPLHLGHKVVVTSEEPCVVVWQRVAA